MRGTHTRRKLLTTGATLSGTSLLSLEGAVETAGEPQVNGDFDEQRRELLSIRDDVDDRDDPADRSVDEDEDEEAEDDDEDEEAEDDEAEDDDENEDDEDEEAEDDDENEDDEDEADEEADEADEEADEADDDDEAEDDDEEDEAEEEDEDETESDESGDPSTFDRDEVEQLVHEAINDVRAEHGLDPISFSTTLRTVARYHSQDMAKNTYFSHTSPDGDGLAERFEQFGIDCEGFAENILKTYYGTRLRTSDGIKNFTTPSELAEGMVRQWMNSQGHRENILKSEWTRQGIGIHATETDGKTEVCATQNFC